MPREAAEIHERALAVAREVQVKFNKKPIDPSRIRVRLSLAKYEVAGDHLGVDTEACMFCGKRGGLVSVWQVHHVGVYSALFPTCYDVEACEFRRAVRSQEGS